MKRKAKRTRRAARPARRTTRRKRPVTPEDLKRYVFVGSPQISPDGARIVFTHRKAGERSDYVGNLWMVSTDDGDAASAFTTGGKDGSPRWSPDGTRIAFVRAREQGGVQIHLIDAGGGEARQLTHFPEGAIGGFKWSPDGSRLAVSFRPLSEEWTREARKRREAAGQVDPPRVVDDWWYRLDGDGYFGAQRFALYVVDVASGVHKVVYKDDTLGAFSYDFSPDGERIAITTNRDRKAMIKPWRAEILIINLRTGKVRPVPGLPRGPKDRVAWSPDGRRLAYAGRVGEDGEYSVENLELYVCDPERGRPQSLTGRTDYCLIAGPLTDMGEVDHGANLRWSPDGRRIYFRLGWHGESHVASVARRGGAVRLHTRGTADVDLGNVSRDGRRFALTVSAFDRPAEVHLGVMRGASIHTRPVTDLNGPLRRARAFARARSHWLRTPDGTRVQTWVMTPPDGGVRRRPAVLEIHGGPHAQYGVGFFHEFQLLAANGYVVFFSNPRGSKGYGRDHCAAIRGRWGTADWTDIQTVTEFMQRHPLVNAKRMAVMGGSYGGYMTNWAIGHTRVFAAAITDRCVSNLVSMGGNSDFVEPPDHYFPGNFWDRPEGRWEQSPIKYFGKVRTPTLVIHSEGDLRCNIEQGEQVFSALKLLNVPTRFVRYPRATSHGMSRGGPPELRIHRLNQILDWLERYLKRRKR